MPAAAVIPAPIAYIKVVAVKKLVVGSQFRTPGAPPRCSFRGAPNTTFAGAQGVLLIECPLAGPVSLL